MEKWFNVGDSDAEDSKRATAIAKLHTIIKGAIAEYSQHGVRGLAYTIHCKPADEENMKLTLCWASEYTKMLLETVTSELCS